MKDNLGGSWLWEGKPGLGTGLGSGLRVYGLSFGFRGLGV